VDADVDGDVVAVQEIEIEVDQLGPGAAPLETVPVLMGVGFDAVGDFGGNVGGFVAGGPEGGS
jgi:hypothetical protein